LKTPSGIPFDRFRLMAILLATTLPAASQTDFHSPLDIAFAPDGNTLAVADATMRAVTLIDPASHRISGSVSLAAPPAGLAWSADGKNLFASESGAGHITEMDAAKAAIIRRIPTGRYPRGLAVAHRRNQLLACDWGLNRLTVIDLAAGKSIAEIPTGRQPSCVALTPDESLAVVGNLLPATNTSDSRHAAEITLIDLDTRSIRSSVRLPTGSTNVRGITISPDGRTAYVAHVLGRFHLPTTQLDRGWVNTNVFSIIDLTSGTHTATILLDQATKGAADPWGIAIDPQARRLFITLSGVHQLAVIDLEGLPKMLAADPATLANDLSALHRNGLIRRIDLPAKGPRGIALSSDGSQLGIAGYFSGDIILLDSDGANPRSIALGPQPAPDPVRRGETAFHDADLCFQQWLSCATCHPGARADGLNWDLLNDGIGNPKNTRSMLLSHATPPVMSLGVRADMPTAARAGFVHIQFAMPPDEDVDAVITYLMSLEPAVSPHRKSDGGLTESANRGRQLFHSPALGCAGCHSEPHFTNLKMKDVGTASPQDRGAFKYDTPTLIELWRTPPYLHDGRATTLREVIIDHNPDDDHGTTSHLKPAEIDDLIEYLLSL
jgi:DNA-binding beta-propeller fold protein YncE